MHQGQCCSVVRSCAHRARRCCHRIRGLPTANWIHQSIRFSIFVYYKRIVFLLIPMLSFLLFQFQFIFSWIKMVAIIFTIGKCPLTRGRSCSWGKSGFAMASVGRFATEGRTALRQHGALVASELGPPILKPYLPYTTPLFVNQQLYNLYCLKIDLIVYLLNRNKQSYSLFHNLTIIL